MVDKQLRDSINAITVKRYRLKSAKGRDIWGKFRKVPSVKLSVAIFQWRYE